MKYSIIAMMLLIAGTATAQILGYNDLGAKIAQEKINGTARFNAMSGAFGALGGDLAALDLNPAGTAVFMFSEFALSFNSQDLQTNTNYYGGATQSNTSFSDISQAGGVFVFNGYNNANSDWGKVAVGFNYSSVNNFENVWVAEGNSGFPTWIEDPNDSNILYLDSNGQYFSNVTDGHNRKYTFSVASQYNNNLFVGAALNTYDMEFYQRILLEEYNFNGNGDVLEASLIQELLTYGDGISFTLGMISAPNDNLRIGLSYQSPVWYQLAEDYLDYDQELYVSNTNEIFSEISDMSYYDYKLRTPSKLTGSLGYVFERQGLLSVDYSVKNYGNIQLGRGDFTQENQEFGESMKRTGELRVGTEWLFDNVAIRGGYHWEQNPYKNAIDSDHLEGYSFGAGIKLKGVKIDFAYQKYNNTSPYNFYPQYSEVNAAELDFDNSRYTISLILNI
jgi:long-subunit fatty acid transport protein